MASSKKDPAVKPGLRRSRPSSRPWPAARDLFLAVHPRIAQAIKWRVPTFSYRGAIASFTSGKTVLGVMFHQGAKLPGRHPKLLGDGGHVRAIRFPDLKAVDRHHKALEVAVKAWVAWKEAG